MTTMQWWDNLWLNEGFATFVGTMAVHELFPEWDMFTQFVTDDWALALDLDSMKSSHPIQVEVFSADQVSEIFGKKKKKKNENEVKGEGLTLLSEPLFLCL
jgi:aminopeptidase 2